ncbi:MAG: AraC family transcriptional regulator [Rhizobiaceae bacterium]|nr:AraC family transcriptional regulator [Rhizobiaceae bacterium]
MHGALTVVEFGKQEVATQIEDRRLAHSAVVFVEKGRGTLRTEIAGMQAVNGPCLFWLFADQTHSYGPDEGTSWNERWALFRGTLVEEFKDGWLLRATEPLVPLSSAGEIAHTFASLHSEMLRRNPLGYAAAGATLHRLVIQSAQQAEAHHKSSSDADFGEITKTIKKRALADLNFPELAREFGMSAATLRRKCHATHGVSPKTLQLQMRIDKAKELLTTSDLSVDEIALEVGYEDSFYFSRIFGKRENCSPSEFRKLHARR